MGTRYAAVTVTYNPDLAVLARQLDALRDAALTVVVDNGSGAPTVEGLRRIVAPGGALVDHDCNLGLAAGLNAGARAALARVPDCEYLLFLDQDTEPAPGDADRLIAAAARLRAQDPSTGLVGPLMVDAETGLSHGVHRIRGWWWGRTLAGRAEAPVAAVRCASVNGSGMVVPTGLFRSLGGFEEALFIDHVDSEYSFRVAAAGHHLYTVPAVRFRHRMGERSLRFWLGGWRVWPYRSPVRHAYLFRNAVILMRRPYVPRVWKVWAAAKLLLTAAVHAVADARRFEQLGAMGRGLRDGWKAPPGAPA